MKLRIYENSLRLRLTQSEVAEFRRSGRVEATICFAPDRKLSYSVESIPEAFKVSVAFVENAIRVVIPTHIAIQWTGSDDVGIQATQSVDANLELQVLIEKDFQCLHRTADQEPDAYPNPLAPIRA